MSSTTEAPVVAKSRYYTTCLLSGLGYTLMYPLAVFKPEFVYKYILLNAEMGETYESDIKSIKAVFLMLAAVISSAYIVSALNKHTVYIDITIVQRLTVVLSSVLLTGFVINQDIFPSGNFSYSMFLLADIVPAIIQGYDAPGGYPGIHGRIYKMFLSTPPSEMQKGLRLESYMGMVFGFMACIYASVVSDIKLSLTIAMISSILPYFWFWFNAHEEKYNEKFLLFNRMAIALALLYLAFGYDFGVMNILFQIQGVNLIVGAFNNRAAAIILGVSSLYLYKIEVDYVLTTEKGPLYWMIGWGIVTYALSKGWKRLFYETYSDQQKKRITGTFWQDWILGVFNAVVGGALDRADYLTTGLGPNVLYLVPPVTLWFSLETKLLTHLWVGTPFHPSWWMYGSTRPGQVERYAPSDWVNVTFSVGTALITIILTSYAWVACSVAVGFTAYRFETPVLWKFAVSHGILFIFSSGLWMIIASSGVPHLGKAKAFQMFPPKVPALFQCDPVRCVSIHKKDLAMGHFLLFLGAFVITDADVPGPRDFVVKVTVAIAWIFTLVVKAMIHMDRFEVPYFQEQAEKEAKKAK
jgi:hypothetical protein